MVKWVSHDEQAISEGQSFQQVSELLLMFFITTQTENVFILPFGGQWRSMRMTHVLSGQLRQHTNHKHFIIEQSRISCTQPHRKDKDCQKSWPWTKAQLTLVALLPFWICSVRTVVLFYFTNRSAEMFCSRSMILKGGAKTTQFYISDLKIRAQTTC